MKWDELREASSTLCRAAALARLARKASVADANRLDQAIALAEQGVQTLRAVRKGLPCVQS